MKEYFKKYRTYIITILILMVTNGMIHSILKLDGLEGWLFIAYVLTIYMVGHIQENTFKE